jgi:hypothetical protein
MNPTLSTAYCSHRVCFICRDKTKQLKQVKKEDIYHAYVFHHIFIKHHTKVCIDHIDTTGLIKKSEFHKIPTTQQTHDANMIRMLDIVAVKHTNIFEKFRKMKYLDDEHCKMITGWSKNEFTEFSKYISSKNIRNRQNRTKEQLIAIYRYWLRKGVDQKSLALLFGHDTRQDQISYYLNQIRVAMNKDIVPRFLGVNKERDFYLQFNTPMTHRMLNLKTDDLVIIADGTYCAVEKSANNDFQYKTYSGQKKDSLFKPFILCCADGYIIDCYGPFAANENDALILDYVLKCDKELMHILVRNKTTMIVDRGILHEIIL